ncbi:MAG: hypothetical protein PHN21_07765, partial [Erysipelotrichaceae bacterium]|nr:hypothetical protein [Erysipelotrichaceae bacterium]
MFKHNSRLKQKIVLIITLAIMTFIFTSSTIAVGLMYDAGFYDSEKFSDTILCQELMDQKYYRLVNDLEDHQIINPDRKITLDDLSEQLIATSDQSPNFEFLIYDDSGTLILKNTEVLSKINKTSKIVTLED